VTAPDDKMGTPIEALLCGATGWVCRSTGWLLLPGTKLSRPEVLAIVQDEGDIGRAYEVALRVRATEVVRACERIGLRGFTPALVRAYPWSVVMAVEGRLRCLEAMETSGDDRG